MKYRIQKAVYDVRVGRPGKAMLQEARLHGDELILLDKRAMLEVYEW